jgi:exonuclease III
MSSSSNNMDQTSIPGRDNVPIPSLPTSVPVTFSSTIEQFNISGSSFSVATNNVCGLSSLTKQQQILTFMDEKHYDIFGLSETKLTTRSASSIFHDSLQYRAWWNCFDDSPSSAGVGLIFRSSVAQFVQSVKGYKGRVIYADLFLRGNVKLRVMQVYIPANIANRHVRIDIDNFILNNIAQASQDSYHIIIMGDFNADPASLTSAITNNSPIHWKLNLLH